MATPPTTTIWADPMDPKDEVDYVLDFSTILQDDEIVESYTIELSPEAIDAGLLIMSGTGRDHTLTEDNRSVRIWLEVDDAEQSSALFDGDGATLPMVGTIVTNSVPSRTRQRTFAVKVAQL